MKKVLCCVLAFVMMITCFVSCKKDSAEKETVLLYFIKADNEIAEEKREITVEKTLHESVLNELLKGPISPANKNIIPKGTKLISAVNDGGMLTVDLSSEFLTLNSVDSIIARYTIVNTMCVLSEISSVLITVEGKSIKNEDGTEIGPLKKDDVITTSLGSMIRYSNIKLYFSDENAKHLISEERSVLANENDSLEKVVLTELIEGPKIGTKAGSTIPKEAKLISVETKDGVCFVNFSQEFVTKHVGGSSGEIMTVYSIVNSLTELPGISKVQFLIDGQKKEVFINMIFNEPFDRDESIIK